MNVLISAYYCSPYEGSEWSVGWNWVYQYCKHAKQEDHIWLITRPLFEKTMTKAVHEYELDNVTIWYPVLPDFLAGMQYHRLLHHVYYGIWQKYAFQYVRRQGIRFDIIHHVSRVDWRYTGEFYRIRGAYTVFGPVGGGQEIPEALRPYQTQKTVELVRMAANRTRKWLPRYCRAVNTYDAVYAVNEETGERLNEIVRNKEIPIEPDIAIPESFRNLSTHKRDDHEKTHFLFSGHYESPRKGAMFLLDCLSYLPESFGWSVDFLGGTDDSELKTRAEKLGIQDKVRFLGRIPYTEMPGVYGQYDVLLFPSLRETSGNAIFEAMASGLPVIGFHTSINKTLKEQACGIFIETERPLEEIKKSFAGAMVRITEEKNYDYYSKNAYRYANSHTWEEKYNTIMNGYYKWTGITGGDGNR